MIRALARFFVADGDMSETAVLFTGIVAAAGLVARLCGAWA